jgi:hypothetical protein
VPKFANYACPQCDLVLREYPVDFGQNLAKAAPPCPVCKDVLTEWIPQIGRMSAGNGPTFTAFETTGPDGKLHRINSITDLRHMEREAEKMAADGVGQTMVWRDYANDRSNRYDHAITKNWEPDDYPGMPTKAQRQALRTLTQPEGEAKLVEMQKAAAESASATAPPAEVG